MKKCIMMGAIGLQAVIAYAQIAVTGANGQVFQFNTVSDTQAVFGGIVSKAVTGRPLSATEERHTLQILGDGTRIEKTDTNKYYRDDQGRTRTERPDGTVLINDPVQGVSAETNGNRRMIRRNTAASLKEPLSPEITAKMKAEMATVKVTAVSGTSSAVSAEDKMKAEALAKTVARQEEDLGYQSINGVTAQGSRTTTTIPAGQIGNDRPIQIVSERWYSPDLQMNVKTTNSDPRFGETSYQLTNILQTAPDPTLFQIPTESK